MSQSTLQKNIKIRLEQKNISVAELQRRAGLRHAVINILHGRSKNPSIKVAQAIAKELGCSVEELLAEAVAPLQPPEQVLDLQHLSLKQNIDPTLAIHALDTVLTFITERVITPNSDLIFEAAAEIYKYALKNPDRKIDPIFVAWLVDKLLLKT